MAKTLNAWAMAEDTRYWIPPQPSPKLHSLIFSALYASIFLDSTFVLFNSISHRSAILTYPLSKGLSWIETSKCASLAPNGTLSFCWGLKLIIVIFLSSTSFWANPHSLQHLPLSHNVESHHLLNPLFPRINIPFAVYNREVTYFHLLNRESSICWGFNGAKFTCNNGHI